MFARTPDDRLRDLTYQGYCCELPSPWGSGRGRPVDDPAEWKICNSKPGPNQQITHFPVVFGVVGVSESCEDTVPE